jgi:uncharacterized repeat protein (TIGR01451 family)
MTAWLPGDGNANNLIDSNHGALQNGALASGAGKVSQAFSLNGVDDFVSVANAAALNVGTGNFSMDAWIKTSDNTGIVTIMDKRVESPAGVFTGYHFFISNGLLGVQLADGTPTNFIEPGPSNVANGSFHHVAVSVTRNSPAGGKLYVDGVVVHTFDPTARSGNLDNTAELRLGGHSTDPSLNFTGIIDEFELFKRALSDTEVADIFGANSTGKCKPVCVAPPAGMVSWYPFEDDGEDIQNGNDGAVQGTGGLFVPAKVGDGFKSGGQGSLISVPDHASLDFTQFTFDAWVRVDAINTLNMPIIWKGNNSGSDFTTPYALTVLGSSSGSPGKLALFITNGIASSQALISNATLPIGTFTHIAATVNGSNLKLYINGALDNSAVKTVTLFNSAFPLQIGSLAGATSNNFFNGVIDELELFSTPLSDSAILSIYNAGSAGKCRTPACALIPSGLNAWWPGEGNAHDIIGPNNGTLQNGVAFAAGKVGQAFSFDGMNDFVNIGNDASLRPTRITVDFWMKSAAPGANAYLLAKGAEGCSYASYSFNTASDPEGDLFFDVFTSVTGFVRSPQAPAALVFDGNWHHIAGTFDGSFVRIYVDGAQQGAGTPATGNLTYGLTTHNRLTLGRFDGPACVLSYQGLLDEIEIFDHALTGAQIQAIYQSGSTGKCKTDLSITKTDFQMDEIPGTSVTYTIAVTNNGLAPAIGATVTDAFPGTITGVTWTCTATPGSSCTAPNGANNINTTVNLAPGGTATFIATGNISPAATGSLTNTASVAAPSGVLDTNNTNNSQMDTDTLTPRTNLRVMKTASPNPVTVGSNLIYTIKVQNLGPSNSTGSTVTDVLPGSVMLVSAPGCVNSPPGTLNCAIGPLASGAMSAPITITVKPIAPGSISNTATVAANETDPAMGNNSDTATVTAQSPPCFPPPASLVSWWPGEGHSEDIKGTNHGVFPSAAFTAGKVGQAFNFTGTTAVTIPDHASLKPAKLTIDAWINRFLQAVRQLPLTWTRSSRSMIPRVTKATSSSSLRILLQPSLTSAASNQTERLLFNSILVARSVAWPVR